MICSRLVGLITRLCRKYRNRGIAAMYLWKYYQEGIPFSIKWGLLFSVQFLKSDCCSHKLKAVCQS